MRKGELLKKVNGEMEGKAPHCAEHHEHREKVEQVREKMLLDDEINKLAQLYKVFGDTTRIKILCALFESEMCVCDIAEIVGISVSAVSHQLRILKQSELVRFRRDGKTIYYSLADDHVRTIIEQGTEHINE